MHMGSVATQQPPKQHFGPDLAVRLICRECRDPHPKIVEEFGSGDLVCGNCGLVLGDRVVDTRSEWRTFANDEGDDPSRVGAATNSLLDGMEQLDTLISDRDGRTGMARDLQRIASKSAAGKAERNLLTAFHQISNMCDSYSLPRNISDTAKQLYKRADDEKLLRGKSVDAIIAACIFIACRQAHVPRTFREICQLTSVPKKTIGQCYKTLEQAFSLTPGAAPTGPNANNTVNQSMAGSAPGTSAEDLLVRYCNHLELPVPIQRACSEITAEARNLAIADGRSPVSIAGGAIYFTSYLFGVPKTAKEVSAVAGVSESTIKLVYRLFFAAKERLVKQEWFDQGRANWTQLPSVEPMK